MNWLQVAQGQAPLIIAIPHAGTNLQDVAGQFVSSWLARHDTDWWIDELYAFAAELGATILRTNVSRSVIDVNRDPSGASLYPGQATTGLCPVTTFDGKPLYRLAEPSEGEIARRRAAWFDPYHARLEAEITRLRGIHSRVVLYDAHSIRSRIPRLFASELPQFNIGTNNGVTCDQALSTAIVDICHARGQSFVLNGRFKGGWTTRNYGRPAAGIHAVQMELAIRGYLDEASSIDETNWPPRFDPDRASPLQLILSDILKACLAFAIH
ncbi:N-formylglutamate deformylase [Sphingobium sp. SCG-1]|uniref:N-formylglutamate deformylase n=1 Tax=Sphingobium sp. SCG-1 TaxID=2072936 RepID=UPI000CD686A1|nr:N-formylglutamate deformylase [Sphingobium sp. SCG-1]AUW59772.1 N-formylglutamate deformylase [Sphingobium sp. SCG-1]